MNLDIPTENGWDSLFTFLSGLLKLGMRLAMTKNTLPETKEMNVT